MKFRAIYLFIFFMSCKKHDSFSGIEVVGHAGAGLHLERIPFPGNTKQSLDFAANLGARHVEVDLQLSSDNHWILFHDDFLNGRTNLSQCIRSYTMNELVSAKYIGFHNCYLQSLLETDFSQFDHVFLDLRHYDACSDFAILDTSGMHQDILSTVNRFPNQQFVVLSRRPQVLDFFRGYGLEVCHEVQNYLDIQNSVQLYSFDFFALRNSAIDKDEVSSAQYNGWRVLLYDVKSHSGNRNAMKKNPNFVMTDAIVSALELTK